MTARGIRNNNPGNIEDGAFTRALTGYTGSDGRFAKFEQMFHGIRALVRLLRVYRSRHGLDTVAGILNRWAPSSENDTSAYARAVSNALSVLPDQKLPDDDETYEKLARAIARHENGADANFIPESAWQQAFQPGTPTFASPPPVSIPEVAGPVKEKKLPVPIMLGKLALDALLTSIPSLIRHFGKGTRSEDNAKLAEVIVPLAKDAIGATNEQELIERIKDDPDAVDAIESAVQNNWFMIAEAGGGGIAGAREHDLKVMQMADRWWYFLSSPSFWALVLLLPLVYIIVLSIVGVLGPVVWSDDVRAAIAGTIVGTIVGGAVGYYWGQTTSRNRSK